MAARVAKKTPRKKGGYELPEAIPAGEILTDICKGQWILGKSIGVGGFGEVYSAAPYSNKVPKNYPNVMKIEPHGNGPLFVEMHFYMKNCKAIEIDSWQKQKKLAVLGMPKYIASGSHEYNNKKYRFLVIDRYGTDLCKVFEKHNKQFPEHVVYKLALQIIDILEYIHDRNYVHADIKGENLLLELNAYDQVYLVDFGLASRCTKLTELKVDPKKAHNGTLQYTSRDAHMGVLTRRGDMEILGYNIIFWLCGSLPWEKLLDATVVQKEKEKAFKDIDSFLNKCFHKLVPQAVHKFITLLASIKFNEIPPYEKFKEILIAGLKKLNHKPDGKLRLNSIDTLTQQNIAKSTPKSTPKSTQKLKKLVDKAKKSPNTTHMDAPTPVNSRKSTIGVVMDKKRGNVKDIEKLLNDMDSDSEYDIQILKKAKIKSNNTAKKTQVSFEDDSQSDSNMPLVQRSNKTQQRKRITSKRQKIKANHQSLDDSETISEPEILLKGTKSRPTTKNKIRKSPSAKQKTTTHRLQSNKRILKTDIEIESDEDMFDM
ncbi:serine/threonine-protein kinase VRK1 [Linepithema humile]|uniref:serine/threonine-protein kinase VRK1 n=1 Tax=Linepithema humile TaxID=83485 RepID=UPI00351F15DF